MNIAADKLAVILGTKQDHVTQTVAALSAAFAALGITDDKILIAALATVRVECPKFYPEHEYGTDGYFRLHYDIECNPHKAADLGNTEPGDGIRYAGRGYIQLTGRSNYRKYGQLLDVDLEDNPDLALSPDIAAKIFALYFKNSGCIQAAEAEDWTAVRHKVNGGLNQLSLYLSIVKELLTANQATQG